MTIKEFKEKQKKMLKNILEDGDFFTNTRLLQKLVNATINNTIDYCKKNGFK